MGALKGVLGLFLKGGGRRGTLRKKQGDLDCCSNSSNKNGDWGDRGCVGTEYAP